MKIDKNAISASHYYAEFAGREKKMPGNERNHSRADEVEIRTKVPAENHSAVRSDKVAEAREFVASGRYEDPEVVDQIVDRLIEQFGL